MAESGEYSTFRVAVVHVSIGHCLRCQCQWRRRGGGTRGNFQYPDVLVRLGCFRDGFVRHAAGQGAGLLSLSDSEIVAILFYVESGQHVLVVQKPVTYIVFT